MNKINSLILFAFIVTLISCGERDMEKLIYSKTYTYGSSYALQFASEKDNVTVAFDMQGKVITVKGLRYKYLIEFSDVKSIAYKAIEANGLLIIKTADKNNEIGIIDKVNFDALAKEVKSTIPSLRFESI